ncbi:MAG: hypothetical protein FVQ82_17265 [Planctomycetes bacterium]|nr:hypothetical protein [Planctomycetota bacterium]
MKKYKTHVRAANMLLEALGELKQEKLQKIKQKLEDFSCKCSDVPKYSRKYNMAISRCWHKAAEKIRSRMSRDLNDFSHQLEQFKNSIDTDQMKLPKLGDVVAELVQIEDELGEIKFDFKARTISIITETIALEGITFGSFEIRLYLYEIKKLTFQSPYKIVALDPNPAGSNCDVTHPHVSDENLCEGDGFIPIRKAIQQGRLSDFFTIIVQILQTYNPDSPYVSLSDWEGTSCYDCGYTVSGDDCYYCEECERDYCSSCSTYCQICDTTVCLGCSYECPSCNKPVCEHCADVCTECNEQLCKDCLNDEGLCNNCQEQRKEQEDEELKEEPTTAAETKPEIQSDSVGQTRISA